MVNLESHWSCLYFKMIPFCETKIMDFQEPALSSCVKSLTKAAFQAVGTYYIAKKRSVENKMISQLKKQEKTYHCLFYCFFFMAIQSQQQASTEQNEVQNVAVQLLKTKEWFSGKLPVLQSEKFIFQDNVGAESLSLVTGENLLMSSEVQMINQV